jgi:hypothetical protein
VVAVRTEREPNRYEPLNETHRRVAEEEEKRRLAEQDQARSAPAQPEPEPHRSATEPEHDPDSPEARLAARQEELEEKVRLRQITPSEMVYQLRRFDNQLSVEIAQGGTPPPSQRRGGPGDRQDELAAETERGEPQSPQRAADIRDQADNQSRDDPNPRVPDTRTEEGQAAEYEITGRGEMSDARAARLERLRGIDSDIERETRENEGKGLDLDRDSGDR